MSSIEMIRYHDESRSRQKFVKVGSTFWSWMAKAANGGAVYIELPRWFWVTKLFVSGPSIRIVSTSRRVIGNQGKDGWFCIVPTITTSNLSALLFLHFQTP